MLNTGAGVGVLIEAAKTAYVQAAAEQLFPTERSSKHFTSVCSYGINTKASLCSVAGGRGQKYSRLGNEQRTARVIHGGQVDRRFRNGRSPPLAWGDGGLLSC